MSLRLTIFLNWLTIYHEYNGGISEAVVVFILFFPSSNHIFKYIVISIFSPKFFTQSHYKLFFILGLSSKPPTKTITRGSTFKYTSSVIFFFFVFFRCNQSPFYHTICDHSSHFWHGHRIYKSPTRIIDARFVNRYSIVTAKTKNTKFLHLQILPQLIIDQLKNN